LAKGPVLFVCVENEGRSQMAEAFAKKHGLIAQSAGTIPSSKVNPIVVQTMLECGIDISNNSPKTLTPEMIERASLVVTMGARLRKLAHDRLLLRCRRS